jgi:hypothetical protein
MRQFTPAIFYLVSLGTYIHLNLLSEQKTGKVKVVFIFQHLLI